MLAGVPLLAVQVLARLQLRVLAGLPATVVCVLAGIQVLAGKADSGGGDRRSYLWRRGPIQLSPQNCPKICLKIIPV